MSGTLPVAVLRAWTVLLVVRWLPPALPHPDGTVEPLDRATGHPSPFTSSLC
ncbi:hypothetical protein HEP86_37830 [Streptomyces sp. RPA4-5]|uniref:hypothetical protein n=1 Tax=Streptomyces TaxID=1883 RepID=UPI00143E3757|nr:MULTISPECIES: hypothetical protein [Streptomyces]MCX4638793.1 hypothetical protein [Streptomyces platensis]QIY59159.1 hypothetical protein HEP86_37830 [Streptomyces sp. RPA4-5]WJY42374.1 hypothetical protein QT196_36835 [Streptomyces sp. P9-2B-2]